MDKQILDKMREEYPTLQDDALEKIYLYERLQNGSMTVSELFRLEYLWGMISAEELEHWLSIGDDDDDEEEVRQKMKTFIDNPAGCTVEQAFEAQEASEKVFDKYY